MTDARQIAAELHAYGSRLIEIAMILDPEGDSSTLRNELPDYEQLTAEAEKHEAPYGYKADGTPRKRPALSAEAQAKAAATRKHKAEQRRRSREGRPRAKEQASLRVLSSTHPTERELEDREVAHTTEGAA